ncbi:primosomal protein [Motilibacter deserti]|uniref:Primosomal protein n=1 Tax=Motilibacter deserti TaxID=2714956 RepID=A0ABX0GUK3_9ACTN|nr:primosomal protein [Motilibacter deserti]NHC14198.1 primosomal protein [Motilibacter deserti]
MSDPTSAPSGADVRSAAHALTVALERHLQAVETRTGEADPRVSAAFGELRDAFLDYEDVLYDVYDEVVPFEIVEDDELDDDEDDEDDEADELEDDEDEEDYVDIDEVEDSPGRLDRK